MPSPMQKHSWTISAFEEQIAKVEIDNGSMVYLPRWILPRGAKEGDILAVSHEQHTNGLASDLHIIVDHDATQKALAHSASQIAEARRHSKDPGGDIVL